ncbi:hypothetical protein WBK31_12885 [Nonomuraea sp. N2-4H]|jgi:hypothetical protein
MSDLDGWYGYINGGDYSLRSLQGDERPPARDQDDSEFSAVAIPPG